MINFDRILGFEWDPGNSRKSEVKHGVSQVEAEEIFNQPLLISMDSAHSQNEARYLALGKTNQGRELAVVFTLRQDQTLIRVISARAQHRKERLIYDQVRT